MASVIILSGARNANARTGDSNCRGHMFESDPKQKFYKFEAFLFFLLHILEFFAVFWLMFVTSPLCNFFENLPLYEIKFLKAKLILAIVFKNGFLGLF